MEDDCLKIIIEIQGQIIAQPYASPVDGRYAANGARAVAPRQKANGQFNNSQHRILRSLAMWAALGHESPSREMVAAASGYSPASGGFNNLLGGLATAGAIGKPMQGHISLLMDADTMTSDEGRANAVELPQQSSAQIGGRA